MLHSLLSVLVGLYSTARRLFASRRELTDEGLPLVLELFAEAFAMRRSVRAVPRADHVSHLEGVAPPDWQSMPCERAGKLPVGGRDLACRGLTFVPPVWAAWILGRPEDQDLNIVATSRRLFPLLTGRVPLLRRRSNGYSLPIPRTGRGSYVAPASTVFIQSVVVEGDEHYPN